mmetsp:Transcript_30780/g.88916  ORF Transcript_30780/g.88916 Transcript_30780/m.88916 type:complete len:283 (+) Transcript_30780:567-1415(+)
MAIASFRNATISASLAAMADCNWLCNSLRIRRAVLAMSSIADMRSASNCRNSAFFSSTSLSRPSSAESSSPFDAARFNLACTLLSSACKASSSSSFSASTSALRLTCFCKSAMAATVRMSTPSNFNKGRKSSTELSDCVCNASCARRKSCCNSCSRASLFSSSCKSKRLSELSEELSEELSASSCRCNSSAFALAASSSRCKSLCLESPASSFFSSCSLSAFERPKSLRKSSACRCNSSAFALAVSSSRCMFLRLDSSAPKLFSSFSLSAFARTKSLRKSSA